MCVVVSAFLSLCEKPSDTKCHPKAWALLLFSFYHCTLLAFAPHLTCDRSVFQTHLIAFQTPVTPTPVSKTPTYTFAHTAVSCPNIRIPWPFLPPLPELTPPQPRVVEIIIFYACHSSPHKDTAYERHTKPTCLQTFVWVSCMLLSLSPVLSVCSHICAQLVFNILN